MPYSLMEKGIVLQNRLWYVLYYITLGLLCSTLLVQVCIAKTYQLPDMGDSANLWLSEQEEQRLGQRIIRQIQSQLTLFKDKEVKEYIKNLGDEILSYNTGIKRDFNFFVVNAAQVNAFATPGGYIGVNTGLILESTTESELASVLSHEIAHVTQRHIARIIEKANKMSLPMTAALLAAILVGAQSGEIELGSAAAVGVQALGIQQQINFTRKHEEEADRVGIDYLYRAGFDTQGMVDFFKRLGQSSRFYGQSAPEFLRTHPVTTSRIAEAMNAAKSYLNNQHKGVTRSPLYYLLAKEKIRVLTRENNVNLRDYYIKGLQQKKDKEVFTYGYAIWLMTKRKFRQALVLVKPLYTLDKSNMFYVSTLADVLAQLGKIQESISILEAYIDLYPDNIAIRLHYAEIVLNNTNKSLNIKKIVKVLNILIWEHKNNTDALKLLARAYAMLGKRAYSHEVLSRYYYLQGNLKIAIMQLERALKLAHNEYTKAKISVTLKKYQKEKLQLDDH